VSKRQEMIQSWILYNNATFIELLEDLSVYGRIVLGCKGVDWIQLAQYRFQLRTLVNNKFHKLRGNS
jgi:hypothetical protein